MYCDAGILGVTSYSLANGCGRTDINERDKDGPFHLWSLTRFRFEATRVAMELIRLQPSRKKPLRKPDLYIILYSLLMRLIRPVSSTDLVQKLPRSELKSRNHLKA